MQPATRERIRGLPGSTKVQALFLFRIHRSKHEIPLRRRCTPFHRWLSVESPIENTRWECLVRTGLPVTGTERHRPCHKISAATGVSNANKSSIRHHREGAVSRAAIYYEPGGLDIEPFSDLVCFSQGDSLRAVPF